MGGFEIAKSYYLNPNIVSMRHLAVHMFFVGIPVFLAGVGLTIYVKLDGRKNITYSAPVSILLFLAAAVLRYLYVKHRSIFQEKYSFAVEHQEPLLTQLRENNMRSTANPL